jgi:beta-mannanase
LRGGRDEAIERWGQAAAAYGDPLILRWGHEMNGTFPWSRRPPEEYVRVFRRVSDRIRRVAGATNVRLYFCPMIRMRDTGLDTMESYYPGDEWCQLVGFDAYSKTERWMPLAERWGPIMARLKRMTGRPVVVGEFGRRVDRRQRDTWLASLADVKGVRGVVYFDMDLTRFKWPQHHWLMDEPMRHVYASLTSRSRITSAQRETTLPSLATSTPDLSPAPVSLSYTGEGVDG